MPSLPGESPFRYKLGKTWVYFNKAWAHLLMAAALGFTQRTKSQAERMHVRHLPSGIWPEEAGYPLFLLL